jgi:hypothetical protein
MDKFQVWYDKIAAVIAKIKNILAHSLKPTDCMDRTPISASHHLFLGCYLKRPAIPGFEMVGNHLIASLVWNPRCKVGSHRIASPLAAQHAGRKVYLLNMSSQPRGEAMGTMNAGVERGFQNRRSWQQSFSLYFDLPFWHMELAFKGGLPQIWADSVLKSNFGKKKQYPRSHVLAGHYTENFLPLDWCACDKFTRTPLPRQVRR